MFAPRWIMLLLITSLLLAGCGRWGKGGRAKSVVYVDEGVLASATAEYYPDGERTPFAQRSTGILIVTAEQLSFLTYDDQSEEYTAALTVARAGLNCGQRSGTVSKGELWCQTEGQTYLFVSKEAGQIAAVFVAPP